MKIKIYDPMPKAPQTPTSVNVCAFTRDVRVRSFAYVEGSTQVDARRVKYIKASKHKDAKRIKRVTYR
jgi:hypothetical protein